jgi:hypothetical protein
MARMFRLLGLRYPPNEMYNAYTALKSGKSDRATPAQDYLESLLDRDLKRLVMPLLDSPDRLPTHARDLCQFEVKSAEAAIEQLRASNDAWIAMCAGAASGEMKRRVGRAAAAAAAEAMPETGVTTVAELNVVEKVIALEGVDLLSGLQPEQLARIASIATEVRCPPGKVVLDPSKPADALFVVLDGRVSLAQNGAEIHTAGQNDVLGAWALFDSEPMPVTATATEDARLLRIGRDDFYELLSDNVEITAAVFGTLVKRFRKLVGQ